MLASLAAGQGYGTLGGDNARTGKNSNPVLYGPQESRLTWFWPNDLSPGGRGSTVIRDNPSTATTRTGVWTGPTINEEAGYPHISPKQIDGALDLVVGYNNLAPAYEYAPAIRSALGSHLDPTVPFPADAANLRTFTWNLDPTVEAGYFPGAGTAPLYQLYVWLPDGPTGLVNLVFPNRYYVFEILYGNGKRWIDVVDTTVSGQGWVRLGNGGRPTNKVFAYSGTPIQIRLYNTQWRDEDDNQLEDNTVQRAVYADTVMAVPERGSITSTPVVSQIDTPGGPRIQVVTATNRRSAVTIGNRDTTIVNSEVNAFQYNGLNGPGNTPLWKWSPIEITPYTTTLDNNDANLNTPADWTSATITNHFGADYRTSPLQANPPPAAAFAEYSPTLDDGDYVIQVYCGGDSGTELFGHATRIFIDEGPVTTEVPIDQSIAGWVTIGTRRFVHRDSVGEPLRVRISNYSLDATDITGNRKAYADEVRFIGAFNETINATPVQTKAFITPQGGGAPVERDVVIVASDDGHIYCLDAVGNGNGTTNVLWAYPSILPSGSLPSADPNAAVGEDGNGNAVLANMPTNGFGTSSPLVQRINNVDYCYVAARNGRVYCVAMAGRGDYNNATGAIGTTSRVWSYPDDFPQFERDPIDGGFGGSVTFSDTTGGPTIFVPTMQGRLYALDAVGNGNKTTGLRWAYPNRTTQTLGPITTTPTVDFGRIYFGTSRASDTVPGQFYALDVDNGNLEWVFEGNPVTSPADNFLGGPCTATAAQLGIANNMVFASNQNRFVYGLDADTGAILWQTSELNAGAEGSLMFTWMSPFDTAGVRTAAPVVVVPVQDGRFDALYARPADVNLDNLKLAWEYVAGSDSITAATSNGFNFMYGGDASGNLYAWSTNAGIGGGMGSPPGSETQTVNDPFVQNNFRNSKVRLITKRGYQLLRQSDLATDPEGNSATVQYDDFFADPLNLRNINAFEWGETLYLLVYDFQYLDEDPNGAPVNPPIVLFQIGVEGSSVRQYGVQAKYFLPPPSNPSGFGEGYAILAFPLQGGGPTSIPPGSATVKYSFQTSAGNTSGTVANIAVSGSREFGVANPLGIYMPDPNTGLRGTGIRTIGVDRDPSGVERLSNGSRLNPSLGTSEGEVGHGQTGIGNFWVVDMSMLPLLKGPGRGLEQVRVTRPDLAWQGGALAVYKPIDLILYPAFEDLPTDFPNTSLDYPNISREALRVTKDPKGTSENALVSTNGVSLLPANPALENDILNRGIHPVLFEIGVDVPRYQPANNHSSLWYTESGGVAIPSGYLARMSVYVDSSGNSILDNISGRREAFRAFTNTLAVTVDERLAVTTPTVDLGALPQGAGFSPLAPGTNDGKSFSPYETGSYVFGPGVITTTNRDYVTMFQPFHVENPGNVNQLDVRLAKGVVGGTIGGPWGIYSDSVDDMGWLDSSFYAWTNFDSMYGLMPRILLQKPRVGDRFSTELSINPFRRYNQNLGLAESLLFPAGPRGDDALPHIGVSIPIGFPVGLYNTRMEVIEDRTQDERLDVDGNNNPTEAFSSPTFDLKFLIREFRLTNGFTTRTAPVIDYPLAAVNSQNLTYANQQPTGLRTLDGALVTAWTSSRPNYGAPVPTAAVTDPAYRIFFATLPGQTPGASTGVSPLRDLRWFGPAATDRWMRQEFGPFPNLPNYDALFQSGAGENVIAGSEKFGAPAMPTMGLIDPLGGAPFTRSYMAFIGTAIKQTAAGRNTENRMMLATVQSNANGVLTVNGPVAMPFDPNTTKGRPSIYQVQDGATIFYSGAGTGQAQLFYTVTDGTNFSRPTILAVGEGFESATSPSVQLRRYTGVPGNSIILEMTFSGKLRGRSNPEIFYGRMTTSSTSVNGNTVSATPDQPIYMNARTGEILTQEGSDTYRALGVSWNTRAPIQVYQDLNGTVTNLELNPGSRTVDRQSGLIRFDSKLGGQIYIDPNLGTVRFSSTKPNPAAKILLDYTPRYLRVSESTIAGNVSPSILWDNRIAGDVSNYSYWFNVQGNGSLQNVPNTATPRTARNFITYTRAASGAGQAARPYWKSLRIGVQLPRGIFTDAAGNLVNITITGTTTGPIQVDPANGRIYFQATDEGRTVHIRYTSVDEASNQAGPLVDDDFTVGLIVERTEQPVPIDQAVNESAITPFLDPFDQQQRPGLIWMLFVSTRAGSPDLYFQTMAPRFAPVIKNN